MPRLTVPVITGVLGWIEQAPAFDSAPLQRRENSRSATWYFGCVTRVAGTLRGRRGESRLRKGRVPRHVSP